MTKRLLCALAILALPVACGAPHEQPPPRGGTEPIVLVEWHPGLAPDAARWALPAFVLLADGTAITAGEDRGVVLSAVRRTLSADQVSDLYARAGDAGLFRNRAYRDDDILDASSLLVRITSDKGRYETTVIQPSLRDRGGRGRAVTFAGEAPKIGTPAGDYVPDRVAAVVVGEGGDTSDVRPWPLAGQSSGCRIVSGARVAPLMAAARTATTDTRWSAGDRMLSLRLRPLLPYERDCADL